MKKIMFLLLSLSILLYGCQTTEAPVPPAPEEAAEPVQVAEANADAEIILEKVATAPVKWEFRGASLAGYWNDSYAQPNTYDLVDYLKSSGVNTIALIVSWYQDDMQANKIYPEFDKKTPTDESLETLIDYIHAQGMEVMLKPHLEPRQNWEKDGKDGWRALIQPSDPTAWFESYEAFITHYVAIAAKHDVALFSIGTEMSSSTLGTDNQARWRAMAENIRKIYNGKLLYSAHEYEVFGGQYGIPNSEDILKFERLPASFWEPFDYAGTTVYYDIGNDSEPVSNTETLFKSWYENPDRAEEQRELVAAFEEWQAEHGKPVIFAEIGYRSVDYAAFQPYTTQKSNRGKAYNEIDGYNAEAQANAYEAAFQVWGDKPWLAGAFWWQFSPLAASARECGADFKPEDATEITYTPCGKAADAVLYQWYNGTSGTPSIPPAYTPALPDLLTLNEIGETFLQRAWRAQTSGEITFNLDSSVQYDTNNQSLHIISNLPCPGIDKDGKELPRYGQIDYTFSTPQDFSSYNSLWFSVKTANLEDHGEVSIVLVDKNGVEWQSTNWLAGNEWQEFQIALRQGADEPANPWQHPVDFVAPDWLFTEENPAPDPLLLDFAEITALRLKATTVGNECDTNPELEVWFGDIHLSGEELAYEPLKVSLPLIDDFGTYENHASLIMSGNWSGNASGTVAFGVVTDNAARNQAALQIMSHLPCLIQEEIDEGKGRYVGVSRQFIEPLDLSGYDYISLMVRGDGLSGAPDGGAFSVVLRERDPETNQEEIWQHSMWISRNTGWKEIKIPLTGFGHKNPWDEDVVGFAVPNWEKEQIGDFQLDLSNIVAIEIQSSTANDNLKNGAPICSLYPQFWFWVDDIRVVKND